MKDRIEMIDALTGAMFDAMQTDADYRWGVCRFGHRGFDTYTDDELIESYKEMIDDGEEE
ncbi:MAG: hypothetical protein RL373_35 [Pseudomonadota bacterium]|jgi:hypothetical protein